VEECPYHENILRADDEPARAAARRARGLSPDARLPVMPAARRTLSDLDGRYERWEKSGKPVRSLALRYRDQEVARHEGFEEVDVRVELKLDAKADLQLWRLADYDFNEDVLLGVYMLDEFTHEGKPLKLELPTGQVVSMSTRRLEQYLYEVNMRFVQNVRARRAGAGGGTVSRMVAHEGGGAFALAGGGVYATPSMLTPPLPSPQTVARALAAFAAFAIGVVVVAGAMGLGQRLWASCDAEVGPVSSRGVNRLTAPAIFLPAESPGKKATTVASTAKAADATEGARRTRQASASQEAARADARHARKSPDNAANHVRAQHTFASATTLSASGWYQLPAGAGTRTIWVRAGDDALLLDEFMSELSRQVGPTEADVEWPNSMVNLRFDWQTQKGTLMARVTDLHGQTVKTFACRSGAQSSEKARAQAVRGVVIELLDYFRVSGAEAGLTALDSARPATQATVPEGARTAETAIGVGRE
jgi:hypothetical protein